MTKNIYFLFCFMLPMFLIAQVRPTADMGNIEYEIYQAKLAGSQFPEVSIFNPAKAEDLQSFQSRSITIEGATFFDFQRPTDFNNTARLAENLSLQIPIESRNEAITLDLVKVEIHSDDFITNVPYTPGLHYRGIVRDEPNSLVSISIFESEVIGFVDHRNEVLTLGKVKGFESLHILYDEFKQGWNLEHSCDTKDANITYNPAESPHFDASRSPGDCVKQKFEVDESLTNILGGVTEATNYGTGVFNNQKTLYDNDGAPVLLSELKVWSNADPAPYVIDEYNTLDSYRALTDTYNGDVAYLGFYQGGWGGGVASAIGGICPQNVDDSKAIGGHNGFYSDVPTYSHDVLIICHEVGHLFGARHTHACVWNGNNTAIDGCAGFTEGGCPVPGVPNLGTIMSYCNSNDFNEGFHPQVAQAIQNYIASRTCTSPCGSGPTCTDGIQNGQETGVDCGGPDCPPCDPTPTCTDGIQNGQETGIDCGGPDCPPCDPTPTCTDGIQNGQETGVDCGGPDCPPCDPTPTCTDGIQNGQETGVDCGGPDCPPCDVTCSGTEATLTINLDNYPMETSWDIVDENGNVVFSGGTYPKEANNTTVTFADCLEAGCYTLNVYDSYGDGLCCNYGNGSYQLMDVDGNVLANGAEFQSIESTQFCVSGGPNGNDYCDSAGGSTEYEYIARVTVGALDNISGNDNGYGDFTGTSAEIVIGSNVNVALTPGYPGNSWPEYWTVWVDYNQDGTFDEATETLATGSGVGELTGTVPVSPSALPGATRLRVAVQYGEPPSPCGEFGFGEVEDYTVVFVGNTQAPNPNATNNSSKFLKGDKFNDGLNVFPNPGSDRVYLNYLSRENGNITVEVFTSNGERIVKTFEKEVRKGRNKLKLNTSDILDGVYIIRVRGDRHLSTDKLTIFKE